MRYWLWALSLLTVWLANSFTIKYYLIQLTIGKALKKSLNTLVKYDNLRKKLKPLTNLKSWTFVWNLILFQDSLFVWGFEFFQGTKKANIWRRKNIKDFKLFLWAQFSRLSSPWPSSFSPALSSSTASISSTGSQRPHLYLYLYFYLYLYMSLNLNQTHVLGTQYCNG